MVHSREKEKMHGGEEQEGSTLGEGGVVKEGEHACVVGDSSADRRIDDAAVALNRRSEASEMVG
jgi:hypothetical protein